MIFCFFANYNDIVVKLNLKKLSDSFYMCLRFVFVLFSGICYGFFVVWVYFYMVWKKKKFLVLYGW